MKLKNAKMNNATNLCHIFEPSNCYEAFIFSTTTKKSFSAFGTPCIFCLYACSISKAANNLDKLPDLMAICLVWRLFVSAKIERLSRHFLTSKMKKPPRNYAFS